VYSVSYWVSQFPMDPHVVVCVGFGVSVTEQYLYTVQYSMLWVVGCGVVVLHRCNGFSWTLQYALSAKPSLTKLLV
jgi:hypothetical protein